MLWRRCLTFRRMFCGGGSVGLASGALGRWFVGGGVVTDRVPRFCKRGLYAAPMNGSVSDMDIAKLPMCNVMPESGTVVS
jgi:hypothetical protein